jgi:ADP-heptose:LPS heptosyltransferase
VKILKRLERYSKSKILGLLKRTLKSDRLSPEKVDTSSISKILVVRQDSRLGNLILMTPLLSALKAALPDSEVDVLVSEGFEDVLAHNPNANRMVIFQKKKARMIPWWYLGFIRKLKEARFDLAIDVSNGRHFSLNGALLTFFSGARYRLGYDRENASTFMNVLVPPPPEETPMAEAMQGIIEMIFPGIRKYPTSFYVDDQERAFAGEWLHEHKIIDNPFIVIHPGGKGNKRWSEKNFAGLIDNINAAGEMIVVIGGKAEKEIIGRIRTHSKARFEVLEKVTVGQMAAVIDRARVFISGDTGPKHLAEALGKQVISIFLSSDAQVYGHRSERSRIVTGKEGCVTVEDVFSEFRDISGI